MIRFTLNIAIVPRLTPRRKNYIILRPTWWVIARYSHPVYRNNGLGIVQFYFYQLVIPTWSYPYSSLSQLIDLSMACHWKCFISICRKHLIGNLLTSWNTASPDIAAFIGLKEQHNVNKTLHNGPAIPGVYFHSISARYVQYENIPGIIQQDRSPWLNMSHSG